MVDPGGKEKGDKTRVCTKYSFQTLKLTKICLSSKETGAEAQLVNVFAVLPNTQWPHEVGHGLL